MTLPVFIDDDAPSPSAGGSQGQGTFDLLTSRTCPITGPHYAAVINIIHVSLRLHSIRNDTLPSKLVFHADARYHAALVIIL